MSSQKGFAHLFLLLFLVIGLVVGIYLVQKTTIFKSHAYQSSVTFRSAVDNSVLSKNGSNIPLTKSNLINVELTLPTDLSGFKNAGDDSTPQTNKTGPFKRNVLVLSYFPLTPDGKKIDINVTGDIDYSYDFAHKRVMDGTETLVKAIAKSSTYLGYKDPAAEPSLQYTVLQNKEYKNKVPVKSNGYEPDLMKILQDHQICDLVDTQNVGEVWIWAYQGPTNPATHQPKLAIFESQYTSALLKRANGPYYPAPVCNKGYEILFFNYNVGPDSALHSWGHQIEFEMNYVNPTLFRQFQGQPWLADQNQNRCGTVHEPPNTSQGYNYNNPQQRYSDCLNWDPEGFKDANKSLVDCNTWNGCNDDNPGVGDQNEQMKYFLWMWQNLPGYGNNKTYHGVPLRNWWEVHANFDQFVKNGLNLFSDPPNSYKAYIDESMFVNKTALTLYADRSTAVNGKVIIPAIEVTSFKATAIKLALAGHLDNLDSNVTSGYTKLRYPVTPGEKITVDLFVKADQPNGIYRGVLQVIAEDEKGLYISAVPKGIPYTIQLTGSSPETPSISTSSANASESAVPVANQSQPFFFKMATERADLETTTIQPYRAPFSYTIANTTPGNKFIWFQYFLPDGRSTEPFVTQLYLEAPQVIVTPQPQIPAPPVQAPVAPPTYEEPPVYDAPPPIIIAPVPSIIPVPDPTPIFQPKSCADVKGQCANSGGISSSGGICTVYEERFSADCSATKDLYPYCYSSCTGGTPISTAPKPTPSPSAITSGSSQSCATGLRQECVGYAANGINAYCWDSSNNYKGGVCTASCTKSNDCGVPSGNSAQSGGVTSSNSAKSPTCSYYANSNIKGVCGKTDSTHTASGWNCANATDYGLGNPGCNAEFPSCYVGCTAN